VATTALARRRLIEEEEVETRPEQVSASCLDESVRIGSIQNTSLLTHGLLWYMHSIYYCWNCGLHCLWVLS